MESIFLQLAVVLTLASVLGFAVFKLKLPLVVAYLLAGVVLSIISSIDPKNLGIFAFLPELGIAFVLFLIGMELDLREIRSLGKPIIISSISQIVISTLAGFAIAGFLGFNRVESIFLGVGLSFSSTVVVIKLLLEKKDLSSLYGKLSIGILLLEDLVAIVVLMGISVGSSFFHLGLQQALPILTFIVKAITLFLLTFILSRYVLEKVFDSVAKSVELLFLTAITWCFVFTSVALLFGFSIVIGAFLAGVALASSPYHIQIQSKVKPLRDFFVTLFFIYLGTQARISDLASNLGAVITLTLYAVTIKPLIFLLILGTFGFRKHTLFQTALNLSQISEFSLVILLVALGNGQVSSVALSVMSAVAVLSIISSAILISYSRKVYNFVLPILPFFEHSSKVHFLESQIEEELEDHVVVIGAHRVGGPIVKFLKKSSIPFLVMDFNPHIVEKLRQEDVKVIYGDVGDVEVLNNISLEKARLIISTATDMGDNELLLEECKKRHVKARVVVRAQDSDHAKALKDLGADYVILPEKVSGDFLVTQLKDHWPEIHFNGLD